MSLQKDANQEGQRFVQHCLPFPSLCLSLSLSLSLCLYLYLSLSLSFYLSLYFLTPGIQPPQFEGGQVLQRPHVCFSLSPIAGLSQRPASLGEGKSSVIPAPILQVFQLRPQTLQSREMEISLLKFLTHRIQELNKWFFHTTKFQGNLLCIHSNCNILITDLIITGLYSFSYSLLT